MLGSTEAYNAVCRSTETAMTQSRAQRRHDRERVIANRTSVAKNAISYFSPTQRIKGGYFDTHKPGGSCGNTHCSLCAHQRAEKRERVKEQRRQGHEVERLTTSDDP